ncbi:MAG: ribosomal-protein-serine acetyltransferase [Chloroflexi bacterium]|jgi:ribosomal-protein-serine acetyltransferase|nr:MAG: ribosomal-protein-serine acetyltransferase [Chloroflexota bacterium]
MNEFESVKNLKVDDIVYMMPLHEYHSEELYALLKSNKTDILKWTTWQNCPESISVTRELIRNFESQKLKGGSLTMGVWISKVLAGLITVYSTDWKNSSAYLGYWVSPNHRGRGVATRSCNGLISKLFNMDILEKVFIKCEQDNYPSQRVANKLHFINYECIQINRKGCDKSDGYVTYVKFKIDETETVANQKQMMLIDGRCLT